MKRFPNPIFQLKEPQIRKKRKKKKKFFFMRKQKI